MPLSRRRLLTSAGIGAAGLGLGAGGYLVGHNDAEAAETEAMGAVAFYGEHQAGIATPAQDRLHFASFDLETESRDELRELMEKWTAAAAEMTAGQMIETRRPATATSWRRPKTPARRSGCRPRT